MADYEHVDPDLVLRQETKLERVKRFISDFRWPILILIAFNVLGVIMLIYRKEFFEALETLSHKLQDMGFKGYILISSLIFLSAFPPIFGYSTFQTLSGYTFGFAIGFPISYFSGLIGAVTCFVLSRHFLQDKVIRLLSKYPNLEAVIHAVEKKGFKLFLMIRISPYPFNMLNFLFSATNISVFQFTLGTAISLLKIAFHVYVGANLTSFVKHLLGEDDDLTPEQVRVEKVKFFIAILFSVIAFSVLAYIYRVAKEAVNEVNQADPIDQEEQMAFLNHQEQDDDPDEIELEPHTTATQSATLVEDTLPRDSMSLDTWDNWGEDEGDDDASLKETIPKNNALVNNKYD